MNLQKVIQDIINRTNDKTILWKAEYDKYGAPTEYGTKVDNVLITGYVTVMTLGTKHPADCDWYISGVCITEEITSELRLQLLRSIQVHVHPLTHEELGERQQRAYRNHTAKLERICEKYSKAIQE